MRATFGSPPYADRLYKVPDNTPAKSASARSGRTSPHYVIQLPVNYLERRPNQVTPDSEEEEDKTSRSCATGGKFPVPAPSLFKAARKSAPVRIRAPDEESAKGIIEGAHDSGAEFHTPELGQSAMNGDNDCSPTTTLGTATPATSAGPFTPSTARSHCSPTFTDQKSASSLVERNQHPIRCDLEGIETPLTTD